MSGTRVSQDAFAVRVEERALAGLEHARRAGVEEAKVFVSTKSMRRLVVEAKAFSLATSVESRDIEVTVHKEKRKGSATINATGEAALFRAVDDALALARFSIPDEYLIMADTSIAPPVAQLPFMRQDDLAAVDLDRMHVLMKEALSILTRDRRLALDRIEMHVSSDWRGLWNTRGVRQAEFQNMAHWFLFGMGRDGDEVTSFDYDLDFAFGVDDLERKFLEGATAFAEKILGSFGPRPCPSYKGPVLLTPRAVFEMLLYTLVAHAGGREVMDGKSAWEHSVGNEVVSPLLTLSDRPHDPGFSGCTAFDSDGVPTRAQTIIDKGILQRHLHDCYTAGRLGSATTATAGGPFGLELSAGDQPLTEIVKDWKSLLVVDRFSGNIDPVTGDLSGLAKASRHYMDGADAGPVGETMIAGNVLDVARQVIAVSRETERPMGTVCAPWVLVEGVSVTGQE